MSDDALRWDRKYQKRQHQDLPQPDPLLIEYLELFRPGQRVVDLASGRGRHTLVLANQGCFVIPIDCSRIALDHCRLEADARNLTVHPVVADLAEFRLPPQCLDGIICFNYLNRELSDNICDAIKPHGHLLMKTFNKNHLIKSPKFNPKYLLAGCELQSMFSSLETIDLNDDCSDPSQTTSFIVATKK